MYREKTSKVVGGRAWTEDDTALLTDMTADEQEKVTAWIRENILPRKTPLLSHSRRHEASARTGHQDLHDKQSVQGRHAPVRFRAGRRQAAQLELPHQQEVPGVQEKGMVKPMEITDMMYDLAEQLKSLRDEKKEAEQRVKDINAALDDVEYRLVTMMADTETQNFTRAGTMFSLTHKTRASAAADRKDELYAALKSEGYGDLVYETVNANSLSAFVNEQITENDEALPEWLEGLVNVYEQTKVSVRKAAHK